MRVQASKCEEMTGIQPPGHFFCLDSTRLFVYNTYVRETGSHPKRTRSNGMKGKDVTYTIDRTFDRLGIHTSFDVPSHPMGGTDWPSDLAPQVEGTPVDIRNHMKKVRQESIRRSNDGLNDTYHVALWVDGYLFTTYTIMMLYYIEEASYARKKPYVFEATVYEK